MTTVMKVWVVAVHAYLTCFLAYYYYIIIIIIIIIIILLFERTREQKRRLKTKILSS